ncbi:MAG: heavy metal translocating P-type ATPase [Clostridiaceae bacterium]|jgi:Cd2+/Zn2+-exporting ATPase|nr:heavy metal translocating P-type ATPase [Clostridiaceae bacterium]
MSNNKRFILHGLGCANCAAKMERKINDLPYVESASINFANKILSINLNTDKNYDKNVEEINLIIKQIEPYVKVNEIESENMQSDINESGEESGELIKIIVAAILYIIALVFKFSFGIELVMYLAVYFLSGIEVIMKAVKNITRGEIFDENFLMIVATVGAFFIKQFPEAAAVMLFYSVGEYFQDMAVNRSRKSISDLMDIRPDYANILSNNMIVKVSPQQVNVGDIIIVKPGEKVPLDGVVEKGKSMMDTSALTGESMPRSVEPGEEVLSGFINNSGLINVKVTKNYGESTVSKILNLVQNASSNKAHAENFITKFARYYTPIVVFSAAALAFIPPLLIEGAVFHQWLYRALVFLVVSCPCALVISIPLSFFGGIGTASKNGILIKGSNYLEALNDVGTVIFDKTGTLTKGVFKVTTICPANNFNEKQVLKYAAIAESSSNHPIASSIVKEYNNDIDREIISSFVEIPGKGVSAQIGQHKVVVGNNKFMEMNHVNFSKVDGIGTIVHVSIDNTYAGYIIISDEIKESSASAIKSLKAIGINEIIMLTGDNSTVADSIGEKLGVTRIFSQLLPNEKVEALYRIKEEINGKNNIMFVGDGINDAPVLVTADIGVAMGGIGSDAAIEAADIVIMDDELPKISKALKIAKYTKKIVTQNIIFALSVKFIILAFSAIGIATMWEAVFGDVGVSLIAVLNSMRILKFKL